MQDFNPDCTINLLIQSQGRPGKFAWACSICIRDSVRVVSARRFLGIVAREEAEWAALLFGLAQAARLQQEKVQLATTGFYPEFDQARKHRDPRIQSMKAEAAGIWNSFRLRKIGKMEPAEELQLKEELGRAFSRRSGD